MATKKYVHNTAAPDQINGGKSTNQVVGLYWGIAEKTQFESAWHPDSQLTPENPDDLVEKDVTYKIYEDMYKDDQVSVAMQLKKDLVLNNGWDIVLEDDDPASIEAQEDVVQALTEDQEIPFQDQMHEILSAYEYGFSATEKVFRRRKDGSLTLRHLRTRHPSTWKFHTDKFGALKKIEQQGTSSTGIINPKSLILYVNNRKFQNHYGTSDLCCAYQAWFVKRHITRFYSIFLEKAASPIPVASYDKNAPPAAVQAIHDSIKKLQTKTALTIPKDIEIEFLQSKSNGEAFIKGINLFNMFIGRSLFVPDLLGFSGSETGGGSFALGQEQFALFFKHIDRRRKVLEDLINFHIVKPIVVFNHGFLENIPKFKLKPIKEDDIFEAAKVWIEAQKGKIYKPSDEEINFFRESVGYPGGDVERHEQMTQPGFGSGFPRKRGNQPNENLKNTPNKENLENLESLEDNEKKFAHKGEVFESPEEDFSHKTDFSKIENELNRANDSVMSKVEPLIAFIMEDLADQIEKKKIIPGQKVDRIKTIKIRKLKELSMIYKTSFKEVFKNSQAIAKDELFSQKFAVVTTFALTVAKKVFFDIVEQQIFDAVGKWKDDLEEFMAIELRNAIKDGKPLMSVLSEFGQMEDRMRVKAERFARTQHTAIMNRARYEFFNDSGIVAAYQFSAILDGRTTPICAGLHGKIFAADNAKGVPQPPLHFNCRSTIVPITKFEQWEASQKAGGTVKTKRAGDINLGREIDIDQFIEENIGEGFSRQ